MKSQRNRTENRKVWGWETSASESCNGAETFRFKFATEYWRCWKLRDCLQIDGITVKNNESANSILDDEKTMFEEAGINVRDAVVDRTLLIGQGYTDSKTKQKCKSIIIRFTFRYWIELMCIVQRKIWKKELKFILTTTK